jgi:hypothetical protein
VPQGVNEMWKETHPPPNSQRRKVSTSFTSKNDSGPTLEEKRQQTLQQAFTMIL